MDLQTIVGDWQGFYRDAGDDYRLELKIRATPDGQLAASLDSPDQGDMGMAVDYLTVQDDRLDAEIAFLPGRIQGRFEKDAVFAGYLKSGGDAFPLELKKDPPEFVKFRFPRLSASGEPVSEYVYRPPEAVGDGWETASLSAVGLDEERVSQLARAILRGEYPQAHGVLIVRSGKLVFEEYFYGHERQRKHGFQSVTKSVTSIVLGLAVDRGLIRGVHQPVYTLFPERRGYRWIDERYDITLYHVLTMTAALDWNETLPYTDPRNDNTAMNMSDDWVGYVLNKGVAGAHGEKYAYTSGLSILLGAIVKNATGLYVDEFAAEHLFEPLGITDYRWSAAPDGTRHTGGGLSLRPRDAAKIGAMMLNGGVWRGQQILSEEWARESTRQHTRLGDYPYGYQWHRHTFGAGMESFCAAGYGGQWWFMFPALDLAVIFTAGAYGGDSKPYEKVEKYILPAVLNLEAAYV